MAALKSYTIDNIESIDKLDTIDKTTIESIGKLIIGIHQSGQSVKSIDISIFTNISVLDITSNTRLLITGLSKCVNIKSLIVNDAVKFIDYANESLESLSINNLSNIDLINFPKLKYIRYQANISGKISLDKLSKLEYLETCIIDECDDSDNALDKVTRILQSSSITTLKYRGDNIDLTFNVPNLESYHGTFNKSILFNSNVKVVVFNTISNPGDLIDKLKCNLPKLEQLEMYATDFEFLDFAGSDNYTKLILLFTDSDITLTSKYNNVKSLTLRYYHDCFDISPIVNQFPYLDELKTTGTYFKIKSDIICPLKRLTIDNGAILSKKLKYFNKSQLKMLKCDVCKSNVETFDIPTLTELYCNEYILTKENAANLVIYHGSIPSDIVFPNLEELESCSFGIDFSTMPKLKIINGEKAQSHIKKHSKKTEPVKNPIIESNDPITSNISRIMINVRYDGDLYSQICPRLNNSYHYIKSDVVNDFIDINIDNIVNAVLSKVVKMDDETEKTNIITKMNDIFSLHEYDNANVIVEALFTALDGKFGIVMDTAKHELKCKIDKLQKQIDDLKASII